MALQNKTISIDQLVLNKDELAFYQKQTGIQDEIKLKEHIIEIAQKALEVYPYHCIRTFGFLRFRILRAQSGYKHLLTLGSTRPRAFFLDLGCCFGNDLRKAIEDGFPPQNIIASDLRAGVCISLSPRSYDHSNHSIEQRFLDFWNFGHELFNSDPSTFLVTFVQGNVLDDSFITIQSPLNPVHDLSNASTDSDLSSLSLQSLLSLTPNSYPEPQSLNPLRGYLSAIHTSAFFHLFDQAEQILIAKKLASLLSPLPGSIIFGSQIGADVPMEGVRNGSGTLFYRHSPDSWKEMWEKEVFGGKANMIRVEAGISRDSERRETIWWTVTRL
ncbi:hypothetical protein F5878DRAFT_409002 [Lentinula raphanica]|uniref:Methyltransferase domain-containing protein n=1 Tax=Lentinula raphanica TaxID=153919 RepID=A0AA38NZ67_9AGAR|nr:hypothetical protein F5880DRAFT_904178 [Lentinula raphanica]KAJ3833359.1 hypothetical protein F5878DRAFT_409002 [Lentinula raphanica]